MEKSFVTEKNIEVMSHELLNLFKPQKQKKQAKRLVGF